MTATGVRIARRFVSKAVAPVWKGDACARAMEGANKAKGTKYRHP
jgi:hypothetical protein